MASSTTLQKKIQEFDSELHHLFSLQPKTPWPQPLLDEILQKFEFLKNLLAAEIASHASNPPQYLHHMEQRLIELNHEFWDNFKATLALMSSTDDVNLNPLPRAHTESLLGDDSDGDDDDEDSADDLFTSRVHEEDPERFPQSLVEEKALVEFSGPGLNEERKSLDSLVAEEVKDEKVRVEFERDVKEEQRRVRSVGSICWAMASGVVFGMALMGCVMGRLCCCFHYMEQEGFLPPT
ncbi:hypothetical protein ACB092_12G100800 [Castanea dentata]